jgi:hypothetical protein
VSKKQTEVHTVQPTIVQPMIDELTIEAPPELPKDDETPPPRGPLHPPQPHEHHRKHEDSPDAESGS